MSSSIDTMTIPVEQPPSGGHPRGLYVLFMAEMWERFCYYGMRVLLTLYLIKSLLMGDNTAFAIYGAYTALVYAAPVLGGRIADKILGYRLAVILGGVLMAIGEFMILGGSESWLYIGMGMIIIGNGYFKANISSIVGKLYADGDNRRDSGFTIFYIGINIGALLATTVVAEVGNIYGYEYGFALAGLGMLAGLVFFIGGQNTFRHVAEAPDPVKLNAPYLGPLSLKWTTILASLLAVPVLYLLMVNAYVVGYLLGVIALIVIYTLMSRGIKEGKVLRDRMIVFIILMLFNIVFWACFEQAGTSLTLFADRNVDRMIGSWEMGAATTQFFNPAFIIIMGSVFSMLWVYLNRIGKNPNIPMKFGIGIVLLGLGYLTVKIAPVSPMYLVPLWVLALLYFLHTVGELFISPIGLSMVTKLVPKDMTGTAMGAWFLSFAGANFMAGVLAMATGVGHGGSEPPKFDMEHEKRIVLLTEAQDSVEVKVKEAAAAIAQLNKYYADRADLSETDLRIPEELSSLVDALPQTFRRINSELVEVYSDTNAYKFPKHIRFGNITKLHLEQVHALNEGLDGLRNATMSLVGKTAEEIDHKPVAEAMLGINGTLETISGKVVDELRGKSTDEDPFLRGAVQAYKVYGTKTATLASHMYWLVYSHVYILMGLITVAIGVVLMLVSGPLNRMMHGVR